MFQTRASKRKLRSRRNKLTQRRTNITRRPAFRLRRREKIQSACRYVCNAQGQNSPGLAEFPAFTVLFDPQATVLPDGTADDVMIIRPIGMGLDSLSVDTGSQVEVQARHGQSGSSGGDASTD